MLNLCCSIKLGSRLSKHFLLIVLFILSTVKSAILDPYVAQGSCTKCQFIYGVPPLYPQVNLRTPIHPSITLVLRLLCWILND